MVSKRIIFVTALVAAIACVETAPSPFFDAVYDAVVGNGRRTYGYNGYNGYDGGYNGYGANGYNGYGGNNGYYDGARSYNYHQGHKAARVEKSWKDICKVHFPASWSAPGTNGITCPY